MSIRSIQRAGIGIRLRSRRPDPITRYRGGGCPGIIIRLLVAGDRQSRDRNNRGEIIRLPPPDRRRRFRTKINADAVLQSSIQIQFTVTAIYFFTRADSSAGHDPSRAENWRQTEKRISMQSSNVEAIIISFVQYKKVFYYRKQLPPRPIPVKEFSLSFLDGRCPAVDITGKFKLKKKKAYKKILPHDTQFYFFFFYTIRHNKMTNLGSNCCAFSRGT